MARTKTTLKPCPPRKTKRGEQVTSSYYVIFEGRHIGYKPVGYGTPLQFITRHLSEDDKKQIADDVEYILGDISKLGEVVGMWESDDDDDFNMGDLDDVFN
jgi:hypothetical protein